MGVILNYPGVLEVDHCTFSGNLAQGSGGAIASEAFDGFGVDQTADLRIFCSTFTGNTGSNGGAISASARNVYGLDSVGLSGAHIENSTFSENRASVGGAVEILQSNAADGATTIRGCLFQNNEATFRGSAVEAVAVSLNVSNSTFWRNSVTGSCLRIASSGSGRAHSVLGCTFSKKKKYMPPVNPNAPPNDSNISASGDSFTLGDTIPSGGPSVAIQDSNSNMISNGFNLCDGDAGGFLTGPGDLTNIPANLVPLGPQDHGGPTATIALLSTSPAVDRGHSLGLTTDQRGSPRPIDLPFYPNPPGGDGSDIGACEAVEPLVGFRLVVNSLHDHDDGLAGINDYNLREAVARVNLILEASHGPDRIALPASLYIRFAPGLTGTLALDRNLGPLEVLAGTDIRGPGRVPWPSAEALTGAFLDAPRCRA